jgi:hypothetical protein
VVAHFAHVGGALFGFLNIGRRISLMIGGTKQFRLGILLQKTKDKE